MGITRTCDLPTKVKLKAFKDEPKEDWYKDLNYESQLDFLAEMVRHLIFMIPMSPNYNSRDLTYLIDVLNHLWAEIKHTRETGEVRPADTTIYEIIQNGYKGGN